MQLSDDSEEIQRRVRKKCYCRQSRCKPPPNPPTGGSTGVIGPRDDAKGLHMVVRGALYVGVNWRGYTAKEKKSYVKGSIEMKFAHCQLLSDERLKEVARKLGKKFMSIGASLRLAVALIVD